VDGRVLHDDRIDILWVNVDAARDDQFSGATRQEQVAILVEVAHVAQREVFTPIG
jgi:hypothetical protein